MRWPAAASWRKTPFQVELVGILADAEHGQLVVAGARDALVRPPHEHVDEVGGAEALAGAIDGRQRLLRQHRAVHRLRRGEAVVAVAARLRLPLAEVGEQRLAPAARQFAQADQRAELLPLHLLVGFRAVALPDPLAQLDEILQAIGEPGVGGHAVAAGAPGLLVVGLDRLRQIEVGDEAHVRLVDAHAEGDGGDDDDAAVLAEALQHGAADVGVETGMIGERRASLAGQPRGRLLDRLARQAVDDAGVLGVLGLDELPQPLARAHAAHGRDGVADVRPVEAGDEALRAARASAR